MFAKKMIGCIAAVATMLLLGSVVWAQESATIDAGISTEQPITVLTIDENGVIMNDLAADGDETPLADYLAGRMMAPDAKTLDLKVDVKITDETGKTVLTKVKLGQKVILWIYFQQLDKLGVPFKQLVNKIITEQYVLSGVLTYNKKLDYKITSKDNKLIGLGIYYTVPSNAKTGQFTFEGTMTIKGFKVKNNKDKSTYSVVK